ncbi:hypothetical protein DFH28DRAFT_927676 [Melampsora americana]|nr:hypothetical protein DFH28DRAFT_927676 [Melampsora americana]
MDNAICIDTAFPRTSVFQNKYIDEFIMSNSDLQNYKKYKVMVTSTFEVIASAHPRFPITSDPIFFHSTVTTMNEAKGLTQYVLKGYPENSGDVDIKCDGLYSINGRLLGLNEEGCTTFMYQNNAKLVSRALNVPLKEFANQVHVSSLGVVDSITHNAERNGQQSSSLIVRHNDYDRINNRGVDFVVQYSTPSGGEWSGRLKTINTGQLIGITGYLIDRKEETNMWMVQDKHIILYLKTPT